MPSKPGWAAAVPGVPAGYRGSEVEWSIQQTKDEARLRDYVRRADELGGRERFALLAKMRRVPRPSLAADLLEARARFCRGAGEESAYTEMLLAVAKASPPSHREALCLVALDVEFNRAVRDKASFRGDSWACLARRVDAVREMAPQTAASPEIERRLATLRTQYHETLDDLLDSRATGWSVDQAIMAARSLGDTSTCDRLVQIVEAWPVIRRKCWTDMQASSALSVALGTVLSDGTPAQRDRLRPAVRAGLESTDPVMRRCCVDASQRPWFANQIHDSR